MLEDLARLALKRLSAHSPRGFYLMVEGASIDKRAHAVDAERTIWDVIEFDRPCGRARFCAGHQWRRGPDQRHPGDRDGRSRDRRPGHHRRRQRALRAERARQGGARLRRRVPVRARQQLNFFPNYQVDERGFRSIPIRHEKYCSAGLRARSQRELDLEPAAARSGGAPGKPEVSVANPARDAAGGKPDNSERRRARRFPVSSCRGTIENGETHVRPSDADAPATRRQSGTPLRATRPLMCRCRRPALAPGSSPGSTRTPTCF